MKFFIIALLSFASQMALAQTKMAVLQSPVESQIADVHVEVYDAALRNGIECKSSQCFQMDTFVNGELAMTCDALVKPSWQADGYAKHGAPTPLVENVPFDQTRLYRNYYVKPFNQRLQYASFFPTRVGGPSMFVISADVNHSSGSTHGGIDVALDCAQQLQLWIRSAFANHGIADLTTHDMKK